MDLNAEELSLLERWLENESFIRWAKGENAQDIAKWEQYFHQHPGHRELAHAGQRLIAGVPFQKIPSDEKRRTLALNQLLGILENQTAGVRSLTAAPRRITLRRSWMAAASIALFLLASGWFYFRQVYNPEIRLATAFGQTITTTLPDSSVVILNANSSLTYRKQSPRQVQLQGEAFFEIKKKPQTHEKFQVYTQDLTVIVLGTSFNVNSRNQQTSVFLEEGKVDLQLENARSETLQMVPGDLVSYSKNQKKILANRQDDALENTSWKEGALFFVDTPLPEALARIEEIYGLTFELVDPALKQRVFRGGVPIRNLDITLETLQETFGLTITLKEGKYLIDQ